MDHEGPISQQIDTDQLQDSLAKYKRRLYISWRMSFHSSYARAAVRKAWDMIDSRTGVKKGKFI